MSNPLVLIRNAAGVEYQVFKSDFERLYQEVGFAITAIVGGDDPETAPEMPETTLAHIATAPAETEPATDAAPESSPIAVAPVEEASADAAPVEADPAADPAAS